MPGVRIHDAHADCRAVGDVHQHLPDMDKDAAHVGDVIDDQKDVTP
jgi:hypothetical protein